MLWLLSFKIGSFCSTDLVCGWDCLAEGFWSASLLNSEACLRCGVILTHPCCSLPLLAAHRFIQALGGKKKKESLSSFSPTISKVTIFGVAKHVCSRLGFAFVPRNPIDVCGNILRIRNVQYCAIVVSLLKHSVTYDCLYPEAPQFSFESVDAVMWLKGDTFWEPVAGCHPLSVKSLLYRVVKQNSDWYHLLDS